MAKRYLITSALPYANGPLHLGHLAGAYLPADIFVRYLRLQGKEVLWVCGSDEHGAAITIRAKKEGISPRDIIDKYHTLNKGTFEKLGISFDFYHRTSEPLHHQTSQEFFLKLHEQGDQFETRTQEQYYDAEYDQFLADRYIKGTCPKCSYDSAYGDQCENCGSDLSPTELINPVSTLSGKTPELRETTHWYFKLDKHNDWLKSWVETGELDGVKTHDPKDWKNHVLGQCLSWLNEGLAPRAITRDLDWGIKVPLDEAQGKVLYVWFDAPIGYISSTKAWCEAFNRGDLHFRGCEASPGSLTSSTSAGGTQAGPGAFPSGNAPAAEQEKYSFEDWWQDPNTELIHFIGKDNIVFHCIIFPAMLKAHGKYNLPKNVPANQFLNFEGEKFSKSRGWGIEQHEYLDKFKDFPNKEDALRWALIRNLPEQRDADFKWDEFIEYHDKDLADKLGNFVNRVTVLTHKYFDGQVPAFGLSPDPSPEERRAALAAVEQLVQDISSSIEAYRFKDAAASFVELATWGNVYLQEAAPWTLAKANPEDPKIAETLYVCNQVVAALSITAAPFIPFTAERLRDILQLPALTNGDWASLQNKLAAGKAILSSGHEIGKAGVLFPKIVDRKDDSRMQIIQAQKDQLAAILAATPTEGVGEEAVASYPPLKETIQFDDFAKLDFRTGIITAAEKLPKADKLLKLTIDLGFETRTVLSGIALQYTPEDVIGQEVVLVANLAPRKMRGVESQGILLMAEDGEGQLSFVGAKEVSGGWGVR
ncbi:MAG: methionine--tRNA ligase subunit beta [Bacteroidota bacterium]